MTYAKICKQVGYKNRSSLYKLTDPIKPSIPDHCHGEAIYALYRDTFGKKPPLKAHQKVQLLIPEPN